MSGDPRPARACRLAELVVTSNSSPRGRWTQESWLTWRARYSAKDRVSLATARLDQAIEMAVGLAGDADAARDADARDTDRSAPGSAAVLITG